MANFLQRLFGDNPRRFIYSYYADSPTLSETESAILQCKANAMLPFSEKLEELAAEADGKYKVLEAVKNINVDPTLLSPRIQPWMEHWFSIIDEIHQCRRGDSADVDRELEIVETNIRNFPKFLQSIMQDMRKLDREREGLGREQRSALREGFNKTLHEIHVAFILIATDKKMTREQAEQVLQRGPSR